MKRLFLLAVGALILVAGGIAVVQRTTPEKPVSSNAGKQQQDALTGLETVHEALRRGAEVDACRTAVMQLNTYLARHLDAGPHPLTEAQRRLLTERFYLEAGDLHEVDSRSFTALDANYLAACFLLQDGLRSCRLESNRRIDQVSAVFAWMIRQVRLREQEAVLLPAEFVLRRSWGSSLERACLFSALMDLLGVDTCILAVPYSSQEQNARRYWIPGVLIDGEIYLFDTRIGLAVPGPGGKGIATLAQVRSDPAILKSLTTRANLPYDVKPEDVQKVEVHIACGLSPLAPRMRFLQDLLAPAEKMNLAIDPEALWARFESALKKPGLTDIPLKVWNHPGDVRTPLRAMQLFLSPSEGGQDKTASELQAQARQNMILWERMPADIRAMPGQLVNAVRSSLADRLYSFYVEPQLSRARILEWMPGLVDTPSLEGLEAAPVRKDAELVLRGHMPRDLLLRGRIDEAAEILGAMESELRRQIQEARALGSAAPSASTTSAQGNSKDKKAFAADKNAPPKAELTPAMKVSLIIFGLTAEVQRGEVVFQLALCKQELAERLQARLDQAAAQGKPAKPADTKAAQKAWETAAGWWRTYLSSDSPRLWPATARTNLARARSCLGDQAGARAILEDFSGELTPLQQTGRLYQAQHLGQ